MAAQLKEHIQLVGTNPLDATLTGRNTKAYLVAARAFADAPQAAANHYGIDLATVYAAMSFYEDNRDAIQQAISAERQAGRDMGAVDGADDMQRIRDRMDNLDQS